MAPCVRMIIHGRGHVPRPFFIARPKFVLACLGDRLIDVFINISTYLFAPLNGLAELREQLRAVCRVGELKGTIMLSPEGINLFVAGTRANIDILMHALRAIPGLENLTLKESHSDAQPLSLIHISEPTRPY